MSSNLRYTMNKRKIVFVFLIILLVVPLVSASIISTIGMQGLNFIHPGAAQVVQTVMCVTNPAGLIACAESYIEGKVVGQIYGEAFQQIAKLSPEAARSISAYNQIKGYIDQGAAILDELKVNENGEIDGGFISFNEKEYDINNLFLNGTNNEMIISNSSYDFEQKLLIIEEGGYLKIKTNINGTEEELVYKNIEKDGFFKFDDKGYISEAMITSTDYSSYTFGNNSELSVGPGTKINYNNGILYVSQKNESFLYGEIEMFGNSTIKIAGSRIECSGCEINKNLKVRGNGVIEITNLGYLAVNSDVEYEHILIMGKSTGQSFLLADEVADLSSYDGNWIIQNERDLEIKAGKGGQLNIEFLQGHNILNTDKNDLLALEITNGNYLRFSDGESRGLIPSVSYINFEGGETRIQNDNLKISLGENIYVNQKPFTLNQIKTGEKYQSVAMEINSASENWEKLRINNYRQFALVSPENKEVVVYNKYGLPVSNKIEDNSLQTLDQLRLKYPNIKFSVQEKRKISSMFEEAKYEYNSFTEENMPPYLLYLTDSFFQQNPEAIDDFNSIIYNDEYNGGVGWSNLVIGHLAFDPTSEQFMESPIRDIKTPIQVITHEYEHRLDNIIDGDESSTIKSNPITAFHLNSKKLLEGGKQRLGEMLNNLYANEVFQGMSDEEFEEFNNKVKPIVEEINEISLEIDKINYKIYEESPTLQQRYNEIVLDAQEKIKNSPEFNERLKKEVIEPLKEYYLIYLDKNSSKKEAVERMIGYIEEAEKTGNVGDIYLLGPDRESVNSYRKKTNELLREYSGLAYTYTLRNYGEDAGGVIKSDFSELSSTYREQPVEVRAKLVQSPNPNIRDVYIKLTQLAFDSGKMKVEEYKAVMGPGACVKGDCSDKLCVEYKLVCCANHPDSPNCKQ